MGFWDVTVVWEGAVSDEKTFEDAQSQDRLKFLGIVKSEANDTDDLVEIYELYHDHDLSLECECHQFVTDGRPWTNDKQA